VGVEGDVPFVRSASTGGPVMAKGLAGMMAKAVAGAARGRRGLARTTVDASTDATSGGRQLSDPSSELYPYDLPTHAVILIITAGASGGGGETLSGTWSPFFFELNTNNGLIYAYGFLAATLYDSGGAIISTVFEPLTLRVRVTDASCSAATLTFGPNVRTVDGVSFLIPAVSTTITAQPDVPLVGDVLCAIADLTALTSPPGSAFALAQLLQELQIAYTNSLPEM
jgi:hypothetical protein